MNTLINDIQQIIFDQLDFTSQTNLRRVSKHFMMDYPITNLYDNVPNYHKLTYKILKLFPHVTKLNINSSNRKVKNVNHMKNLQILHAEDNCGINDASLAQLVNLTELNVNNNHKVKNVNNMRNL